MNIYRQRIEIKYMYILYVQLKGRSIFNGKNNKNSEKYIYVSWKLSFHQF